MAEESCDGPGGSEDGDDEKDAVRRGGMLEAICISCGGWRGNGSWTYRM